VSQMYDAVCAGPSLRERLKLQAMGKLVGALIEELASDVPDDPRLETVRADLLTASRSYESGEKQDLALRFYLAIRSLLHEIERRPHEVSLKLKEAEAGASEQSVVDTRAKV
jgi:hypothetical protein